MEGRNSCIKIITHDDLSDDERVEKVRNFKPFPRDNRKKKTCLDNFYRS